MRRIAAILGASIIVLVIGLAVTFARTLRQESSGHPSESYVSYRDAATGVGLRYPDFLKRSTSAGDASDKILLRLVNASESSPLLATLRFETGLRMDAVQARMTTMELIMSNSEKALPERFKGYQKVSSKRFEQVGHVAGDIVFTYDSPVAGERIKQRLVMVSKSDDTAVYLAMQCKAADFERLNAVIFSPMLESITFN